MTSMTEDQFAQYMDPTATFDADAEDVSLFDAMRMLTAKAKMVNANVDRATAEIERIKAWEEKMNASIRAEIENIKAWIEEHVIAERDATGQKTFSTPWGTISTTVVRDKVKVVDEQAFMAWAHENPDGDSMIRVKEEPQLTTIKEAVLNEGMDIPGVDIVAPEKPYSVTFRTE